MPTLQEIGIETLAVLRAGTYPAPSGARVDIRAEVDRAVAGTELVEHAARPAGRGRGARIEITGETTAAAARRLAEAGTAVTALSFANAVHPGGGFIAGAKAQEEDLCRCSALYDCLAAQPEYYRRGAADRTLIYPDICLWSPLVPFFRDDGYGWLERPYLCSIVTAAAPFAGQALRADAGAAPRIRAAIERRAELVLNLCAAKECRALVLGAWGCGAFENDPVHVADTFARLLSGYDFDEVIFAVYDRAPGRPNLGAFRARFGG